jgi:glycosyltransferase involved in cell wall biosynthesis
MRIAVVNWSWRKLGGAESYLDFTIPALSGHGNELAMFFESDVPVDRPRITLPPPLPVFRVDTMGIESALVGLAEWRPEILVNHGLANSSLESRILNLAPAVMFAHGYQGTCISGEKALKLPRRQPCTHQFGWRCLLRYYPRRCGGLNPTTMWKLYRQEARRLGLMRRYTAIITASGHMRREFIRHGFPPSKVHALKSPIASSMLTNTESPRPALPLSPLDHRGERHVLFVGRMTDLKGGTVMLDALPQIAQALGGPLKATFVGDGPARIAWQLRARHIQSRYQSLTIEFSGWLDGDLLVAATEVCDLLVMPSVWPEPFGRSGPEAGLRGIPAVAFAVGGIPEWLIDGVSGHLAPGDPPTVAGLANAIVKALKDPDHYEALRRGAREQAQSFSLGSHITSLLQILEASASRPRISA